MKKVTLNPFDYISNSEFWTPINKRSHILILLPRKTSIHYTQTFWILIISKIYFDFDFEFQKHEKEYVQISSDCIVCGLILSIGFSCILSNHWALPLIVIFHHSLSKVKIKKKYLLPSKVVIFCQRYFWRLIKDEICCLILNEALENS